MVLRNTVAASAYLNERGIKRSPKTLAKYRSVGGGPKFKKFGAADVTYDDPDLDQWIEEQLSGPFGSTSEVAA